jgi:hypothetical protein
MAHENDNARQRGDIKGPRRGPASHSPDAAGGPAGLPGPAVDPVCPYCRQPVYPGYGDSDDRADFVHFDCLRDRRGGR